MVDDFARAGRAQDAITAFYQTLSTIAGRETAEYLLDAMSEADG